MPVYNGLTYREKRAGSPEGSQSLRDAASLTTRLMVDWSDFTSGLAGKALLGNCRVRTNGDLNDDGVTLGIYPGAIPSAAKYLAYTNPLMHPEWPGYFYADSFQRFEGVVEDGQGASGMAAWRDADLQIGFRSAPDGWRALEDNSVVVPTGADPTLFTTRGVPYEGFCVRNMEITETATVKAQAIPPHNSGLVWASDLTAASLAAYVPIFETRIKIEWYPVPLFGFNDAAFRALIGTTNKNPFPPIPVPIGCPPSMLSTRPAFTLVMGPVSKKLIRLGDTSWAWKITFNLAFFPFGANYFFRYNRPDSAGGPGYDGLRRRPPDLGVLFPAVNWNEAWYPP